eukprot:Ihof_evm2s586 gene=Ihof_evmTU2s586
MTRNRNISQYVEDIVPTLNSRKSMLLCDFHMVAQELVDQIEDHPVPLGRPSTRKAREAIEVPNNSPPDKTAYEVKDLKKLEQACDQDDTPPPPRYVDVLGHVFSNLSKLASWRFLQESHNDSVRNVGHWVVTSDEEVDNPLLRRTRASTTTKDRYLMMIWVSVLVAFVSVTMAVLGFGVLEGILDLERVLALRILQSKMHLGVKWALAVAFSVGTACAGTILVLHCPAAKGGGLPQVVALLNGVAIPRYFSYEVLLVKPLAMVLAVGSGLCIGMEGPLMHLGSLLATVATTLLVKAKFVRGLFAKFANPTLDSMGPKSPHHHPTYNPMFAEEILRMCSPAGAAVGFTVAFRAPLGGVAFAIEEATSFFRPSNVLHALIMTGVAYWVLIALYQGESTSSVGSYFLPYYYHPECTQKIHTWILMPLLIMGALSGVLGHIIVTLAMWLEPVRKHVLRGSMVRKLLDVAILAIITTTLATFLPIIPGMPGLECRPLVNAMAPQFEAIQAVCAVSGCNGNVPNKPISTSNCFRESSWAQCLPSKAADSISASLTDAYANYLMCSKGEFHNNLFNSTLQDAAVTVLAGSEDLQWFVKNTTADGKICYYPMRSMFWVPPEFQMRNILVQGVYNMFSAPELLVYFFVYTTLAILSTGCTLPTGFVIPNLIIGATFGRLCGLVINSVETWRGMHLSDPGWYATLGAAGLWAGTMQVPFTVAVTLSEICYLPAGMWPGLLVVSVTASWVASALGGSITHRQMHAAHIPYLPWRASHNLRIRTVHDIMTAPAVSIPVQASPEHLLSILKNTTHGAFPVVDNHNKLIGMVARLTILKMLDNYLYEEE